MDDEVQSFDKQLSVFQSKSMHYMMVDLINEKIIGYYISVTEFESDWLTKMKKASNNGENVFNGKMSESQICSSIDCINDGNKRCSKCKKVFYCSKDCQKKHWKVHKKSCN